MHLSVQAPLFCGLLFALYMLVWLLIGIVSFKTVPEEAELLRRDIARAKEDLARRGVL